MPPCSRTTTRAPLILPEGAREAADLRLTFRAGGRDDAAPARPTAPVAHRRLIEDACAFAWLEFVVRQPDRINPMGWLRVVASREAVGLARHDGMHARSVSRSLIRPARPGFGSKPGRGLRRSRRDSEKR